MKRVMAMLGILVLLLGLGACGGPGQTQGEAYNPETDYGHLNEAGVWGSWLAEAPAGYYFIRGYYLFYAEKETMEALPLCSRPDCRHEEETDDTKVHTCNAFLGPSGIPFVQYYEGALYAVEGVNATEKKLEKSLVKLSLDGTVRQRLLKVSDAEILAIHRGYLYLTKGSKVSRVPLEKPNQEPELLFQSELDEATVFCQPKGNHLLLREEGVRVEDQTYIDRSCVYDLQTGSLTEIAPEAPAENATVSQYKCGGENLLYAKTPNVETEEDPLNAGNVIYTCDMAGKNEEVLRDWSEETGEYLVQLSYDGTYYYEEWVNYLRTDEEALKSRKFRVYDKDFNLLYDGDCGWLPWVYWVSYGYGDHIFFLYSDETTGERVVDYVDKRDFAQGIFQPRRLSDREMYPVFGW